jgi:hypothetical protein
VPREYEQCNSELGAIMFSPAFDCILIGLFGLVDIAFAQSCAAE